MSQVNFFMLENDEREFVEMLSARGDTLMFSGYFFPVKRPTPTRDLPPIGSERVVTLVNSRLRPDPECEGRGAGDFAELYLFDGLKYPQCEFSRCRFQDGILLDGRIYAKIGWLESPTENRIYRSWYSSIERWIKKRYRRHRSWWLGPAAEVWSLTGGQICFAQTRKEVFLLSR